MTAVGDSDCMCVETNFFLFSHPRKLYAIKEKVTQSLNVSQNAIDELKEREDLSNQLLAKQDEHIRYICSTTAFNPLNNKTNRRKISQNFTARSIRS